jgi:hypothetical protein
MMMMPGHCRLPAAAFCTLETLRHPHLLLLYTPDMELTRKRHKTSGTSP